ncbi:hypothetical protein RHBI111906_01250 [Rhodothermus bifroesti]|nr:hypothetical protein HRbin18_00097 [bacterium HR18]
MVFCVALRGESEPLTPWLLQGSTLFVLKASMELPPALHVGRCRLQRHVALNVLVLYFEAICVSHPLPTGSGSFWM